MADMTVAKTILEQLGGRRFLVMTGAKNLTATDTSLSFRVNGRTASGAVNGVRIVLTPMDTYTVETLYTRGSSRRVVATEENVYCDVLAAVFTRLTGLDTKL
jgi:hypothetical protein